MPGSKINEDWYEFNRIIKALIREMDKPAGPDWQQVFNQSQDLVALSYTALKRSKSKSP